MSSRQLLPEEVGITVLGRLLLVGLGAGALIGGATGAVLGAGTASGPWTEVYFYLGVVVGLFAGVLTQSVTALVVHLVHRRVAWGTVQRSALVPPVLASGVLAVLAGDPLPADLGLAGAVAAVSLAAVAAVATVRWCLAPYPRPRW